eukprot:scaffold20579_cov191-Skeletonema_dohrnii-CCMP3373.AAC.1
MFHDRIDDVMKWVEMEDIYNAIVDSDSDSDEDDDDDESSCGKAMRSNHLNFFHHRCSSSQQQQSL